MANAATATIVPFPIDRVPSSRTDDVVALVSQIGPTAARAVLRERHLSQSPSQPSQRGPSADILPFVGR